MSYSRCHKTLFIVPLMLCLGKLAGLSQKKSPPSKQYAVCVYVSAFYCMFYWNSFFYSQSSFSMCILRRNIPSAFSPPRSSGVGNNFWSGGQERRSPKGRIPRPKGPTAGAGVLGRGQPPKGFHALCAATLPLSLC